MRNKQARKNGEEKAKNPGDFRPGEDARRNLDGRPLDQEHIMEIMGIKEPKELSYWEAGWKKLLEQYAAGNLDVIKYLDSRGLGLRKSQYQGEDDEEVNWMKLPNALEIVRLLDLWQWTSRGCPESEQSKHRDAEKIEEAIRESGILERVKKIRMYQRSELIEKEYGKIKEI